MWVEKLLDDMLDADAKAIKVSEGLWRGLQ